MRDYWLTQELLKLTGWGYVAICVIVLLVAVTLPKSGWGKAIAAAVVIGLASILPLQAKKEIDQSQVNADEFKVRYAKAKALFDERCKTAGEKIYRTVANVEGIRLLNLRSGDIAANRSNQNWEGAALPNDATGDGYIERFLSWERNDSHGARGQLTTNFDKTFTRGFRYIDVSDVSDASGVLRRYRLKEPNNSDLVNEPVKDSSTRYAVGFTSSIVPEDRANWVAGTTIKIIDVRTGEIMAERTSFAFEPGLGNTLNGRSPWGFAVTCPALVGWQETYPTRFFVDQVLQPKQGD
jgi:hypothetical protein